MLAVSPECVVFGNIEAGTTSFVDFKLENTLNKAFSTNRPLIVILLIGSKLLRAGFTPGSDM